MDDRDFNLTRSAPAAPAAVSFSPWRALARHWRESVRYFGWLRSLRELAGAGWGALLELLLSSRRKAAFGDLDYDWEHSVNTTRSNVSAGTQFLTGLMARPYFPTEPWLFEQIIQALPIDFSQFTFIDLGSGKGRVLLMACEHPFKKSSAWNSCRSCMVPQRRISPAIPMTVSNGGRSKRSAWMRGTFSFPMIR
jgi:hypothetical protein